MVSETPGATLFLLNACFDVAPQAQGATRSRLLPRIAHTIGVDSWRTVLSVYAVETSTYLVLDDPILGKLDSGNLIGY